MGQRTLQKPMCATVKSGAECKTGEILQANQGEGGADRRVCPYAFPFGFSFDPSTRQRRVWGLRYASRGVGGIKQHGFGGGAHHPSTKPNGGETHVQNRRIKTGGFRIGGT